MKSIEERFWEKVDKSGEYCKEWLAYRNSRGYGYFKLDGKRHYAHRVAWIFTYGPIPKGMWVLHHCDNPPCCEPSHLFLGTHLDNMADMVRKKRAHNGLQIGEHNGGAKLTEDDVRQIRALQGQVTIKELGKQFGVHFDTISKIHLRKIWQHID